jgi:hypothetical protein
VTGTPLPTPSANPAEPPRGVERPGRYWFAAVLVGAISLAVALVIWATGPVFPDGSTILLAVFGASLMILGFRTG